MPDTEYTINSFSPTYRDFLLNRNIISDTIENSGLETLLHSVGRPVQVFNVPEAVQGSLDIETEGVLYKDLNVILNKYQGSDDDYNQVSINFLPGNINSTWGGEPFNHESYKRDTAELEQYTTNNVPATGPFKGGNIREFNTTKNNYLDVSKQTRIDFNTQPVPSFQIGSYLDEYGNLNIGGPSTQPLDLATSLLGGGGVGFDPNGGGVVTSSDVRSSLAGRLLSSVGAINDTRLGQLSANYLAASIGNNIAFGLQEETIGRINTNVLSLATGGALIVPNYSITVAKGGGGKALDLVTRMVGFEVPVSLLAADSDIFTFGLKSYNHVGNIERANSFIANTGKGQVLALFGNINANTNTNIIGKRGGYAPGFDGDINNPNIYALSTDNTTVSDVLNSGPDNYPIAQSSYNLDIVKGNSFDKKYENDFIWGDGDLNKASTEIFKKGYQDDIFGDGAVEKDKKSILYKTKELFKSDNMRTLVSGKAINGEDHDQLQSAVRVGGKSGSGFMSKGSGVLSELALKGEEVDSSNVFCRAWTPIDRYDSVGDLIRHGNENWVDGINPYMPNRNKESMGDSVLGNNGFVNIGPYKGGKIEKFMFSLENLAWSDGDSLSNLLPCEVGPGDPLTGNKGRIMWFPPYDISFNESTSVSWDRNNFIGRGEPVYTYNNTERTGTLSWKIIIDHPNYMNFMEGMSNDEVASFVAGCLGNEKIKNRIMTPAEQDKVDVANNKQNETKVDDENPSPVKFFIYFKNDETDIATVYENGRVNTEVNGVTVGTLLDYNDNSVGGKTGEGQGLGTTSGEGIVGGKGTTYVDRNNFGFNGQGQPLSIPGEDNPLYRGWMDTGFTDTLATYMANECKYCRIKITGHASQQGGSTANQTLSEKRATSVKDWLLGSSGIVSASDKLKNSRIKIDKSGQGESSADGCTGDGGQDRKPCKKARKTYVTIEYDAKLKDEANSQKSPIDKTQPVASPTIPFSRFYTECDYFEKLEQSDPFVYTTFEQKIKNFHPAFHSITPEGFNSRLNFLQQCTRQGPTRTGEGENNGIQNLAFGRPPVCILRIGDFYHTKIIIESLTIDYDPMVWDLNPEGVGVQPMIANITLSFAFVGGSSLKGPINKLQNAVSFNYFANTEMYDPRADRITVGGFKKVGSPFGTIVHGETLVAENFKKESEAQTGPTGKNDQPIIDEVKQAEGVLSEEDPKPEEVRDAIHLKDNITVTVLKPRNKEIGVGIKFTDGKPYPEDMSIQLRTKIYGSSESSIVKGLNGFICNINIPAGDTFSTVFYSNVFKKKFKDDDSITATLWVRRDKSDGSIDFLYTNKTLIIDLKE